MVTRSDCVGSVSMLKVQLDSGDIRHSHGDQLRTFHTFQVQKCLKKQDGMIMNS